MIHFMERGGEKRADLGGEGEGKEGIKRKEWRSKEGETGNGGGEGGEEEEGGGGEGGKRRTRTRRRRRRMKKRRRRIKKRRGRSPKIRDSAKGSEEQQIRTKDMEKAREKIEKKIKRKKYTDRNRTKQKNRIRKRVKEENTIKSNERSCKKWQTKEMWRTILIELMLNTQNDKLHRQESSINYYDRRQ